MKIWWKFCCCIIVILAVSTCKQETPDPASHGILTLEKLGPLTYIGAENVVPRPESSLSLEEFYKSGEIEGGASGVICVTLDATSVLENNDQGLDFDDYLSRSTLTINNQEFLDKPVATFDELGVWRNYRFEPQRDEYIPLESNGVGPYNICWRAEIGAGTHTVEFSTQKTSGEIRSFSWSFTITE